MEIMAHQTTYDTIVIGGGVVGASVAYHLAREGAKILLVDNRDVGRATDAGAGIIAAETSGATLPPAWYPLSLQSGIYYPELIQALKEADAGDTGYSVCGELIVAADEDELEAYEQKKQVVFERQRQRGLPSDADLHEVSPDEARDLFPPLKTVLKALYFRGCARVDGRLLAAAMLNAAHKHGLDEQNTRVDELLIENRRIVGVRVGADRIYGGKVIIAGGAWSSAFGEQLGCAIYVEPQRGQILHMRLDNPATGDWPVVDAFHGHYLVCWPDGRVVAGATRETGTGFVPQTTIAGVREVIDEALRVAPGLSEAVLGEIRVGLRPRTIDSLPVMGGVPGVEGIYLATGHGASGLQLGPFSGKLAADWALGRDSALDISAFSVTRWNQT
jgi:D-amino-acid dehydrogenase